jgi:hypothetical protein
MMNEPPQSRQPGWIQPALVAVLAAQVGLLWLHGGLLNRQHSELRSLRQDIQELAEVLESHAEEQAQAPEEGSFHPAASGRRANRTHLKHHKGHRHPLLHVASPANFILQDAQDNAPEGQDPTMKDIQKTRDSEKKAVSDARDIRQKLSIEENIRKADEKKKVEAATSNFYPLLYWATGIGLLAFIAGRVWRARAGGR